LKKNSDNESNCLFCGTDITVRTFKANGKKYCSSSCRVNYRKASGYFEDRYKKIAKPHLKKCEMCERKILSVGERKSASKFCSKKCMYLNTKKINNNQKYITIKIPIDSYKELFRGKNV
jgi:hypothetical protein